MWQVSGRSDITDFEEVVRLDKEYITNWNIGLEKNISSKKIDLDRQLLKPLAGSAIYFSFFKEFLLK